MTKAFVVSVAAPLLRVLLSARVHYSCNQIPQGRHRAPLLLCLPAALAMLAVEGSLQLVEDVHGSRLAYL